MLLLRTHPHSSRVVFACFYAPTNAMICVSTASNAGACGVRMRGAERGHTGVVRLSRTSVGAPSGAEGCWRARRSWNPSCRPLGFGLRGTVQRPMHISCKFCNLVGQTEYA